MSNRGGSGGTLNRAGGPVTEHMTKQRQETPKQCNVGMLIKVLSNWNEGLHVRVYAEAESNAIKLTGVCVLHVRRSHQAYSYT